jgi:cyclohexanone monooxygenase
MGPQAMERRVAKHPGAGAAIQGSTFNREQIRERYRIEREKRLRPDGTDQYLHLSSKTSHHLDDPYVAPGYCRPPVELATTVLILGGGFGGLMCAARLQEAGISDFRIVEKAGDFGGTWYWNRYPGASCDVESYIYMPLLEELGYLPTEKYARADEIRAHCERIGRFYNLYDRALFQTEVSRMEWNEPELRWVVRTDRTDKLTARFVCVAAGPLRRPKLPDIPGVQTFGGRSFHTSRWDYSYTGGTERGALDGLRDKSVGIIGTGATAVQCVPYLAESAKHLYVFQRTPSTVDVRNNRATPPEFSETLVPGWQKARRANFTNIICAQPESVDLVDDGWTKVLPPLLAFASSDRRAERAAEAGGMETLAQEIEDFDIRHMEQLRSRIDQLVHDETVAEALKPYYKVGCKRPGFHDQYLQVFNRPNVTLVDTKGAGVECINAAGVRAARTQYDLDCLIFATGFEWAANALIEEGEFEIVGRGGLTLREKWADGPMTLHGTYSSGFPNCFFLSHIQAGVTPSFTHIADEQALHFATIIKDLLARDIACFDVDPAAEADYVEEVERLALPRLHYDASCTPSYLNHEGRIDRRLARNGPHGDGPLKYIERITSWRRDGNYRGLELAAR